MGQATFLVWRDLREKDSARIKVIELLSAAVNDIEQKSSFGFQPTGFFVDKIEKQWYSQNKFLKL
jgi:phosphoenolpyruvate synthase/pyruvate phosphate dikinase